MVSRDTSDSQEGLPSRRWTRGWCHLGKDLSIDLGASRQLCISHIRAKNQRAISTIHRSLTTQQHIIFMFRQEPCLPNKCLRLVHVCLTFAKTRCWVPHWRLGYYIGGLLLKSPDSRLIVYSSEATSTLVLTMYVFILSSSVVWRWLRVAVRLWESLQVFRYRDPQNYLQPLSLRQDSSSRGSAWFGSCSGRSIYIFLRSTSVMLFWISVFLFEFPVKTD